MGHTVPDVSCVKDVNIYNSKFTIEFLIDSLVDIANKASFNHMIKENL